MEFTKAIILKHLHLHKSLHTNCSDFETNTTVDGLSGFWNKAVGEMRMHAVRRELEALSIFCNDGWLTEIDLYGNFFLNCHGTLLQSMFWSGLDRRERVCVRSQDPWDFGH